MVSIFKNSSKKFDSNYYLENADQLGWGELSVKVDLERVELLKKYIKGKSVLDVGCGVGVYVDQLAMMGYQASGVDIVKDFLEEAKKNKEGEFFLGSAEKLPFKDNSFETILLFDILEHGDERKILLEAKRVAQKRVLVIVPRVVDSELKESGVIFRHYSDKSHLREYLGDDFKKLSDNVGLKLIHLQTVHNLFNETVFMALFNGPKIYKKIIRKIVLFLLPQRKYPTEFFAVFEK